MCRCTNCQRNFKEFKIIEENYNLDFGFEKFAVCPYCRETGYIDLIQCTECSQWVDKSHTLDSCCKDCLADLANDIKNFFNQHFTKRQHQIVGEMLEDSSIIHDILKRGV